MRKWNSNSASLLQSLKQDSAFSGDFAINSKECVQEEDESFSKNSLKMSSSTMFDYRTNRTTIRPTGFD